MGRGVDAWLGVRSVGPSADVLEMVPDVPERSDVEQCRWLRPLLAVLALFEYAAQERGRGRLSKQTAGASDQVP